VVVFKKLRLVKFTSVFIVLADAKIWEFLSWAHHDLESLIVQGFVAIR
jgi:hypothetical protein